MRSWKRRGYVIGLMLWCTVVAGCTISIQPWTKPTPQPPPGADGAPGYPYAATKGGYPPGQSQMPMPGAYPPSTAAGNESMVQMIKQLNETEDLRKALQDQVLTLKKQLRDREENLRQASYEMEESSKQVRRSRDELRQWQTETDELRERVKKLEDSRASLKLLIDEILLHLDHGKEPKLYHIPSQSK